MRPTHASPVLRLVNADPIGADAVMPFRDTARTARSARAEVTRENRLASLDRSLDAADPRWVLAVRTAAAIEGGRAAFLPPDRRRNLNRLATRLGLRPFDASLVIAIVQDAARSAEDPSVASRLGPEVAARLQLVRTPEADTGRGFGAPERILAAAAIAALIVYAVIGWILGR